MPGKRERVGRYCMSNPRNKATNTTTNTNRHKLRSEVDGKETSIFVALACRRHHCRFNWSHLSAPAMRRWDLRTWNTTWLGFATSNAGGFDSWLTTLRSLKAVLLGRPRYILLLAGISEAWLRTSWTLFCMAQRVLWLTHLEKTAARQHLGRDGSRHQPWRISEPKRVVVPRLSAVQLPTMA